MLTFLLITLCAQFSVDASELTPELILDHPGLRSGDFIQVQDDLLNALEAHPKSPHTLAAILALEEISSFCPEGIDPERLIELHKSVNDPTASLQLRARIAREMKRRMFRDDPPNFPTDLYPDFITNWATVGPFGSLDSTLPLERHPDKNGPVFDLNPSYVTPWGQTLDWQSLRRPTNYSFVRPGKLIEGNSGCGYLLASVRTEEQKAILELFCEGGMDVFWNGKLLHQIRSYHSADQTHLYHLPVQVQKENILLIRFAIRGDPAISARLHGSKAVIPTIESSWERLSQKLERGELQPSVPNLFYPIPSTAKRLQEEAWQVPLTSGPGEMLLQMASLIHHGRCDRALSIPEPKSPQWLPTWLRLKHRALQRAPHLSREVVRRTSIQVEERLDGLKVSYPQIQARKIRRLSSEDKLTEAISAAEALSVKHPNVSFFSYLTARALTLLDPSGLMARSAIKGFLERFPNSANAWHDLSELANLAGNPILKLEYLRKALQVDGAQSEIIEDLLNALVSGSTPHRKEARSILHRWEEMFPKSNFARQWKRRFLVERNLIDAIEDDLILALKAHPFKSRRHRNLVNFYLEHGNFQKAAEARNGLDALLPGNHYFSTTSAALGSLPADEQFFLEFAPDRMAALEAAESATDASTALVLDSGLYYFFEDGTSHRLTHTISKALDRNGTEILHEQAAAPGTRISRVINSKGVVYEPVLVDENWVMPALNPGDLVEIQFETWRSGRKGSAPNPGKWSFASFEQPFVLSRYVVFLPNNLPGEWRKFQFEGDHREVPWKNGVVHIFTQSLSPRFIEEPLRPSNDETLPWVTFGTDFDHEEAIALQRYRATWFESIPADLSEKLTEVLDDLKTKNHSNIKPPHQRAEDIYNWITQNVLDFQGLEDLSTIWHSKRGYPIGLMAAMLRLDGIPFEWAVLHPTLPPLLDPRPEGSFRARSDYGQPLLRLTPTKAHPQPGWFLLPEDGRGYPFLSIPSKLAGCSVLVLEDHGVREEKLPIDSLLDTWSTDLDVRFILQQDQSARAEGTMRVTDTQGPLLRERILEAEPSQRSQIARQILGSLVPGLNISEWDFIDLEKRGAPFELKFLGSIPGFVKGTGTQKGCRLRIQPMRMASALGTSERIWPLVFRLINRSRWHVELDCNGLFELEYGPVSSTVQREGYTYNFQVAKSANTLSITRFVEIAGLWLEPEELPEFLEIAGKHEQEEKRAVRLIPLTQ